MTWQHFTLLELTRLSDGRVLDPSDEQLHALDALVEHVLDPWRKLVGPLRVTSGLRDEAHNRKVSGAPNSQHLRGEAVDVVPVTASVLGALVMLIQSEIPFDQAILEPGWLHVSFTRARLNRCQVLERTSSGYAAIPLVWTKAGKLGLEGKG